MRKTLLATALVLFTTTSAYAEEATDGFYCEKTEHKVQFVFVKKPPVDGKGLMPGCSFREFDTDVRPLPKFKEIGFSACTDRLNEMAKEGYKCSQKDNTK